MMLWPSSSLSLSLLVVITVLLHLRQSVAFTYSPLAEPIAVRSPFFTSWKTGGAPLPGNWALNAMDTHITAWTGFAHVDGVGYLFMGDP